MSRAFRLVLRAREKLYESGFLSSLRLNHPVISIGNLTVGGTGKTPLVIALAEGLLDRGFHPVVLSRGYGKRVLASLPPMKLTHHAGEAIEFLSARPTSRPSARRAKAPPATTR